MSSQLEPPIEPSAEEPFHEVTEGDYATLYEEQKAENARLRAVIAAAKIQPVSDHPQKDARPGMSYEKLRAQVGEVRWLNMSKQERIAGLGVVDPTTVDEALLYRVFGRGADSSAGKDLFASNPLKYRTLKECAKALHIFGAEPPKR